MDVHLDLTMSKAELLTFVRKSDYVEEYGDIVKALGDGSYALVDKELWSLSSSEYPGNKYKHAYPRRRWAQCCIGLMMLSVILDRIRGSGPSRRCSTLAYLTKS